MAFEINPQSGIGPGQINIKPTDYNTSGGDISQRIRVNIGSKYKEIKLIQKAATVGWNYTFNINPSSVALEPGGSSITVSITSTRQKTINGILVGEVEQIPYSAIHYSGAQFVSVNGNEISAGANNNENTREEVIRFTQSESDNTWDVAISQIANWIYYLDLPGSIFLYHSASIGIGTNQGELYTDSISYRERGDGVRETVPITLEVPSRIISTDLGNGHFRLSTNFDTNLSSLSVQTTSYEVKVIQSGSGKSGSIPLTIQYGYWMSSLGIKDFVANNSYTTESQEILIIPDFSDNLFNEYKSLIMIRLFDSASQRMRYYVNGKTITDINLIVIGFMNRIDPYKDGGRFEIENKQAMLLRFYSGNDIKGEVTSVDYVQILNTPSSRTWLGSPGWSLVGRPPVDITIGELFFEWVDSSVNRSRIMISSKSTIDSL